MIDRSTIELQFPNRPRAPYFDAGAVGIAPDAVRLALEEVSLALAQGTLGSRRWHSQTDDAPRLLALDLGVGEADVEFLASTSVAFNAIARALPEEPRGEVLFFADDFPTVRLPWLRMPQSTVRPITAQPDEDRTAALVAAIDERTAIVAVSHVHASTGTLVDLEKVARACRSVDALLVVDGAHAAGLIDRCAEHADVYVATSYKWLLAGFGAAVVATNGRFRARATPTLLGYANAPPSTGLQVGHDSVYALAALQAAASVRHAIGTDRIRSHMSALTKRVRDGAHAIGMTAATRQPSPGIASFAVPDASAHVEHLASLGISTAARDGLLRISPGLTTTDDDIEKLLGALAVIVPHHTRRNLP